MVKYLVMLNIPPLFGNLFAFFINVFMCSKYVYVCTVAGARAMNLVLFWQS